MRTTRAGVDAPAPPGIDPLGSAARLRRARLDPDVLGSRVLHVLVDTGCLVLLLAVPALATLVAVAVTPSGAQGPAVPLLALTLAGTAVLLGVGVVWPRRDDGRTAGMRWAGLRVVDRTGRAPRAWQLAVRAATVPVDVLVGPVLVLARPDRRRLGDLLAGTQVVRDLGADAAPHRPAAARTRRARSRSTPTPPRRRRAVRG